MPLAEHLANLNRRPERFAIHPEHQQATDAFMRLMLVSRGMPQLLQASQFGSGLGHYYGNQAGTARNLLRGIIEDRDPETIGPMMDLHSEMTGHPLFSPEQTHMGLADSGLAYNAHNNMLMNLAEMHHMFGGTMPIEHSPFLMGIHHVMRGPGNIDVPRMFHESRLVQPHIRDLVQDAYTGWNHHGMQLDRHLVNLENALHQERLHGTANEVAHLYDTSMHDFHPLALAHLHELIHPLMGQPYTQNIRGILRNSTDAVGNILATRVMPFLVSGH